MRTLLAPTRSDLTLAHATAVTLVMVQVAQMSMSAPLTRTLVMPTLPAPTRSEDTLAHATSDTLATVALVSQILPRLRHQTSMSVLPTHIIVMQMQRVRTLQDHSHARATAASLVMVRPDPK